MLQKSEAGKKGNDIRSDCWIGLEAKNSGGIDLQLTSKVEVMYGDTIRKTITRGLEFFSIRNARVEVFDSGALPFVMMARIETAVKRLMPDLKKELIPDMKSWSTYPTEREKFRRSRLYLPGNEPKFMINAGLHQPDGIILDLEDSVAPEEKDAAQSLVRNALCQVNFYGAERMVRINQFPRGLDDLPFVVPYNVHVVLIPKCESAEQVIQIDKRIKEISKEKNRQEPVYLMPIIESALGVIKAFEIAKASENVIALTIGLEDYTADIGTQRTPEGKESFWARSQVVNAAKAAGVQAIDTVFTDVSDMEGLRASVLEAKSLGFEGKGCIHPRQIPLIHQAFAPDDAEIEKAQKIVLAFKEAEAKGLSVVSLGSKMIDPPVVKRAQRVISLALAAGKLKEDWERP